MHRAIDHDDIRTWSILASVKQQIRTNTPALRAASAEITQVYVPVESISLDAALLVGGRLASSLGVAAFAGLSILTVEDWDTRPAWMQTEPWRTRYEVDALLTGFTAKNAGAETQEASRSSP